MIGHVRGIVSEKFNNTVIVDVAGIGYEIQIASGDYDKVVLDDEVKFYTHHHIREQAQELFGFSTIAAKRIFELLITVQGVGPKAALAILSLGESEDVRNAIASSDHGFIQKASGVGKKTAERVIVDLVDKVGLPTKYSSTESQVARTANIEAGDEALEALMALGYNLADATRALEKIDKDLPTAKRVTLALKG